MKELKEKLHQAIDEYGISDERTVAISQELDNKKFFINNNCDPKDYLFFKDLWAFKKDLP